MKARVCLECQKSIVLEELFCERTEHMLQGRIVHDTYIFCFECGIKHALNYPVMYHYVQEETS